MKLRAIRGAAAELPLAVGRAAVFVSPEALVATVRRWSLAGPSGLVCAVKIEDHRTEK
jgi:hypothetical protein